MVIDRRIRQLLKSLIWLANPMCVLKIAYDERVNRDVVDVPKLHNARVESIPPKVTKTTHDSATTEESPDFLPRSR
jgi:hypothetical protein